MLIFFSGGGHMSGGHMSCVRVPGPSSVAAVVLGGAGHASLAFDAVIMASSLHRRLLARRLFAVVAELNDADALVSPINIPRLCSELCGILKTTQPSYLHNLITVQPPRSTRSSSLVTLARPSTSTSRITDRSFQYASPRLWNQLPASLRQPRTNLSNSLSGTASISSIDLPL